MELAEALDDIRTHNRRNDVIDPEDLLRNLVEENKNDEESRVEFTAEEEQEINDQFELLRKLRQGQNEDNEPA